MANKNLNKAKEAPKDESYTQLKDVNNELRHYREHFRGKTVLCNSNQQQSALDRRNMAEMAQLGEYLLVYQFGYQETA